MLQLCGVIIICALIATIICLAEKNGKQAARLKALKRELDGISRAQEMAANVAGFDDDTARRRLCEIATEQSRKQRM
jgi:hypothetical protein